MMIQLTTAATVCCYDGQQGICSLNADKISCIDGGGNWTDDATCSAETRCTKGCCIAGNVVAFSTERRCEILSSSYGVTKNFNSGISESQCYSQSQTGIDGACVVGEDKECRITSTGNCTGEFYSGKSCTDIDTKCKTTYNTTCYKEDVYSVDSCGNPDRKTSDCEYSAGTICRKEGTNAFCKSLNCGEGKMNGQSWCVNPEKVGGSEGEEQKENSTEEETTPVGSRYFRKYCLNGEIFTEPCADFRAETCVAEENGTAIAKCKLNDWSACLDVGNDSQKCGELEQCKMWIPGSIGDCVKTGSGNTYCGFGNKFYKMNGTENSMTRGEEVTERDIVLDVDSSGGEHFTGEENTGGKELINDLHLSMCIPKVAGGLEFYPKVAAGSSEASSDSGSSGGSSSTGVSSAIETCGKASYSSEIQFVSRGKCWYLKLDKEEKNYFGNAGLLLDNISLWAGYDNEDDQLEGAINGSGINPFIYCIDDDSLEWWMDWSGNFYPGGVTRVIGDIVMWSGCEECSYIVEDVANVILYVVYGGGIIVWALQEVVENVLDWVGIQTHNEPENFGLIQLVWDKTIKEIPIKTDVVESLQQRCQATSDCQGKLNWVGAEGAKYDNGLIKNETNVSDVNLTYYMIKLSNKVGDEDENGDYILKFNYNFTCVPYKAPAGASSCDKCGSDNLACSEYRCKSLGQRCAYYEPEGIETGICQNSDDNNPPSMTLSIELASPIRPNTAVKINAITDEKSECKFDMGSAGTKFEEMKYDFNGKYILEHNVTLNVPGQNGYNDSEGYSLINREGKYEIYVRCMDAVGNWNLAPSLISFEVMKTPDNLATILSEFNPESDSRIAYGQTSKTISFKINEPAECKWDSSDVGFSEMENNFGCDTLPSDTGMINGYHCSGTLTNITRNVTEETKFYIRCKDQIWLEGKEDDLYTRNTNEQSIVYVLKPSKELWMRNITPTGELKISGANMTTTLKIITADGSDNGISECYWSQNQAIESYVKFFNTNSVIHTQTVNIREGENIFYLACRDLDARENEINRVLNSTTFNVIIDTSPPVVILSYVDNKTRELNIVTDERAECKYTTNQTVGCLFDFSNGTSMTTTDKIKHSTFHVSGIYYIKCKDEKGFVNANTCGIIVKL